MKIRITLDTDTCSVTFKKPLNGLLWAELVALVDDYHKFERGIKGTRFDPWLKKVKDETKRYN